MYDGGGTAVQRQSRQARKLRRWSSSGLLLAGISNALGQSSLSAQRLGRRSRAPKKSHVPDEVVFQTKTEIAIDLVDRALRNGIRVAWWTFDEFYGRDSKVLDGLEERHQRFVCEIPCNTRVWTTKPDIIPRNAGSRQGLPKQVPCEVRSLLKYSSKFYVQTWQKYRIKDTHKGAEVWKIKHLTVWRQTHEQLPSKRQTLIVARNVRTGETKFFLANAVVGKNGVTLRGLLRVAFGRWAIEAELRVSKEELGMDHFEVRGWRCIHRHYFVTGLSFLLCSRIRLSLDKTGKRELTVEQVRRSINCWLQYHDLPREIRNEKFQQELAVQQYHQQRNAQAARSHTKTRTQMYLKIGIDVGKIKSCVQTEN
jgi:SRSO17 transposase